MSGVPHPLLFRQAGGPAIPALRPRPAAVVGPLPASRRQRAKLWELSESVHCSIVGTCLTTDELRRVVGKVIQTDITRFSDHDLHAQAVGLCNHHNTAAKLLHKALDQRHGTVIKRFARLQGEPAVLEAWAQARQAGDIPGAYWAVLTHPDIGHPGMRRAFGDVHMLSHLVGAANRADIRRLTTLEQENAALRAKVERQQLQLRDAITSRDATIRRLGTLAESRIEPANDARHEDAANDGATDDGLAGLRHLMADLRRRLDRETGRRERLEQRLASAAEAMRRHEQRARAAEAAAAAASRELALLEQHQAEPAALPRAASLPAQCILYVGGRPGSVDQLRAMLQAAGGTLLSHDGGRHDHPSLLAGLVSQADQVVFPVDCVSHHAALAVKRLCRQSGKRFVPLRSSGIAPFLAAMAGDTETQPIEASP